MKTEQLNMLLAFSGSIAKFCAYNALCYRSRYLRTFLKSSLQVLVSLNLIIFFSCQISVTETFSISAPAFIVTVLFF